MDRNPAGLVHAEELLAGLGACLLALAGAGHDVVDLGPQKQRSQFPILRRREPRQLLHRLLGGRKVEVLELELLLQKRVFGVAIPCVDPLAQSFEFSQLLKTILEIAELLTPDDVPDVARSVHQHDVRILDAALRLEEFLVRVGLDLGRDVAERHDAIGKLSKAVLRQRAALHRNRVHAPLVGPREVGEDRLARLRRFCPGLGETENPIRVLQVRKLKRAVAQLREPLLRLRHRRRRQGDGRRDDKRRDQAT